MNQEALGKKKGVADIVFLIDVTGSMKPCLDALKANIGFFVEHLTHPGPNAESMLKDWRIKVCGYRDAAADGDKWWEERPFTSDLAQIKADLASLQPMGGVDEPESLLDGLWKLATMPAGAKGAQPDPNTWRYQSDAARCVLAFTDASCHMTTSAPEAGGAQYEDVEREIIAARLRLSIFCPEADCYHTLSSIPDTEVEMIGTLDTAVKEMEKFTSDTENFRKVLDQLTRTITASATNMPPDLPAAS